MSCINKMIAIYHDTAQCKGYHVEHVLRNWNCLVIEFIQHVLKWLPFFFGQIHAQLQYCLQVVSTQQLYKINEVIKYLQRWILEC